MKSVTSEPCQYVVLIALGPLVEQYKQRVTAGRY